MTLPRERRREGGRKKQTETEKTERQKRKKSPLGLEGPPHLLPRWKRVRWHLNLGRSRQVGERKTGRERGRDA